MKTILTVFICLILFSCIKHSEDPPSPPGGTSGRVKYNVNGQPVTINHFGYQVGKYALFAKQLKGTVVNETRYLLIAHDGFAHGLEFSILTDSLLQRTYHYDSTDVSNSQGNFFLLLGYNSFESGLIYSGDYLDVSITSYNNGRISGTFIAKLTPLATMSDYSTRGTTLITDGLIENVEVVY